METGRLRVREQAPDQRAGEPAASTGLPPEVRGLRLEYLSPFVCINGQLSGQKTSPWSGGRPNRPAPILVIGPCEGQGDLLAKDVTIFGAVVGTHDGSRQSGDSAGGIPQRDIVSPRIALQEDADFYGRGEMKPIGH